MNEGSRFYWLKLQRGFFRRPEIDVIEAMPNGKEYVLFYLKLLCESVDRDGLLRFTDTIPYNDDMLASITHTNIDIVRAAVQIFRQAGLMEMLDDGTLYMREVKAMTGSAADNDAANRKRLQRQREAMGQLRDTSVTKSHESIEYRDKSIELRDKKESKEKERRFTPPTLDEVRAYCQERNSSVDPERFVDWYTANGWKVGKNPMKDWKAAVRSWEQRDKAERPAEKTKEQLEHERNDPYLEPLDW